MKSNARPETHPTIGKDTPALSNEANALLQELTGCELQFYSREEWSQQQRRLRLSWSSPSPSNIHLFIERSERILRQASIRNGT
jgi:hypothetical protein